MIVWGGGGSFGLLTESGGRYDPFTDTWMPTSTLGVPSARQGHTAISTGRTIVVWGGHDWFEEVDTGGQYDPSRDTWTPTSTAGAASARAGHTAIWTGSQMIIWGGSRSYPSSQFDSGGRYDPAANTWVPISTVEAPSGRYSHTAVWTGSTMLVWGGFAAGYLNTGGRYDPVADSWAPTSIVGAPTGRMDHTAVWTGSLMLVWGGSETASFNGGGRYALGHALDNDGEGYTGCAGDCDDANPAVYPGAPQICDGINNNCNEPTWPAVPANEADADHDGWPICASDCNNNDPTVHPGAIDICDGQDNNCDGVSDEGNPGGGSPCSTGELGVCGAGTEHCVSGALRCVRNADPSPDTCNGLDDDCDGLVDELLFRRRGRRLEFVCVPESDPSPGPQMRWFSRPIL